MSFAPSLAIVEGRYGSLGRGEPPTPGISKMIPSVSASADKKGCASSQLALMPLNSSRGGRRARPRFTATQRGCPSTSIVRTSMVALADAEDDSAESSLDIERPTCGERAYCLKARQDGFSENTGSPSCHRLKTYVPGAGSPGRSSAFPKPAAAATFSPDRLDSHSLQCTHQLPVCFSAVSMNASA